MESREQDEISMQDECPALTGCEKEDSQSPPLAVPVRLNGSRREDDGSTTAVSDDEEIDELDDDMCPKVGLQRLTPGRTSPPQGGRAKAMQESDLLAPEWSRIRARSASPAASVSSDGSLASTGTRPATFMFTLFAYLRDHPDSPFFRWSADGTFLVILDKERLMKEVVTKLFNQKSYASFARQLNIYGWKRMAATPIPGEADASTAWKHAYITRDSTEVDIRSIKRNANDKVRKKKKTPLSDSEESEVGLRRKRAKTDSSVGSTSSLISAVQTANLSDKSPSEAVPLTTLPSGPISHSRAADDNAKSDQSRYPKREGRATLRVISSGTSLSIPKLSIRRHTFSAPATPVATDLVPRLYDDGEQHRRLGRKGLPEHAASRTKGDGNKGVLASIGSRFQRTKLAVNRPIHSVPEGSEKLRLPQNTVDIYIACAQGAGLSVPVVVARDRFDLTIWVDETARATFVLAGDVFRKWMLWDAFPESSMLHAAPSNALVAPRPVGVPKEIRDAPGNTDPVLAPARERLYLEISSDPGACGQMCLVFSRPDLRQDTSPVETICDRRGRSRTVSALRGNHAFFRRDLLPPPISATFMPPLAASAERPVSQERATATADSPALEVFRRSQSMHESRAGSASSVDSMLSEQAEQERQEVAKVLASVRDRSMSPPT